VPGDDTTLINFNTIPGNGNYPTYAWQPDEVVADRYRLRIPDQVERTQAWQVMVVLYGLSDGQRLPVTVEGQASGEALGLGLVRVGSSEPAAVPEEARIEPALLFGDPLAENGTIRLEGVRLLSATTEKEDVDHVQVQVWWRATAHTSADYTTLVHFYDAGGTMLAAGDAPPLRGAFPTSLWEPGDLIADEYVLPLEEQGEQVGLGWYDPITGARLLLTEEPSETVALFPLSGESDQKGVPPQSVPVGSASGGVSQ